MWKGECGGQTKVEALAPRGLMRYVAQLAGEKLILPPRGSRPGAVPACFGKTTRKIGTAGLGYQARPRARVGHSFAGSIRMRATSYSRLAATVFVIVALLQLLGCAAAWPISLGGTAIPVWACWIAFLVAGGLAWLGFSASRD